MFVLVRHFILKASNPVARGLLFLPVAYGFTIFINVFSVLHDGPPGEFHSDCMLVPQLEALHNTTKRYQSVNAVREGANKSLARPERKQATATKPGIYSTYSPRSSIHFLAH